MQEHIFDLPHGVGNPRNSEGSFVRLQDGRILFVYSRYNGKTTMITPLRTWLALNPKKTWEPLSSKNDATIS